MGHGKAQHNPSSMYNGLPSAEEMKSFDHCCGIHGAARARRGMKKAASAARRRQDKDIIRGEIKNL